MENQTKQAEKGHGTKKTAIRRTRLQNAFGSKGACNQKTDKETRYTLIGVTKPSTYQVGLGFIHAHMRTRRRTRTRACIYYINLL